MLKICLVFLIIVYLSVLAFSIRLDSPRWKRVIYGHVPVVNEGRIYEYDVIRYYAWIGSATSCTSHKVVPQNVPTWWTTSTRPCFPDVDDQMCGGALIHPRIVQTAGHCVASKVLTVDDPNKAWLPNQAWSVWERMLQIFVGYTDIEDFVYPSFSRFFLMHPKFETLRNDEYGWGTHDFGWIVLNSEPFKLDRWPNLVAPVPTNGALVDGSVELLKNQDVCLFAGFGAWQLLDDEILKTESSRYMRYGWQLTKNYMGCWWYIYYIALIRENANTNWKYKRYASWFCHVPFGDHLTDHPGVGDSGGPVHCNGRMLALLSGGKWQYVDEERSKRAHVTRTMGLVYSIFENTANFRQYFVSTLKYYARVRQVELPKYTFRPPKKPSPRAITGTMVEYSMTSAGKCQYTVHILNVFMLFPITLMILKIW